MSDKPTAPKWIPGRGFVSSDGASVEDWKNAVETAGGSVSAERLAIIQRFISEERARNPAWPLSSQHWQDEE